MKKKEFNALVKGDVVWHVRYGRCEVVDSIPDFGPVLSPFSQNMKGLLVYDSGAEFDTPYLETEKKALKSLKNLDEETLERILANEN